MPAILLFFSSLKLWHYIAVGAIILIGGLLGYSQVLKSRLTVCTARSEAFIAETKAAAQTQIALNAQEAVKRGTITRNLEETNAKLQSDLAKQYADSRRLLHASARSGRVPPIPATPERGACGQDEADPVATVHEFEGRVLDILEQGDKAIAEALTLEDWLDQQSQVE